MSKSAASFRDSQMNACDRTASSFERTAGGAPDRTRLGRLLSRFARRVDVPFRIELWDGTRYDLAGDGEPAFRIRANNKRGLAAISSLSEIEAAKSYIAGDLELDGDLLKLFDLRDLMTSGNVFLDAWRRLKPRLWGQVREDRKAIAGHYEYDDDFYMTFLDATRTYSQGVYESDDESLETAMRRKLDYAIDACRLQPGMRVLDVGGGWGAFTEYAGKRGIRVTSLTIADHSLRYINELIDTKNLPCKAIMGNFLEYESNEPYDAIVILGVIEHMPDYRRVVDQLERLLKTHGRAYLDGSADRRKFVHNTFMNQYVFPGNHCMLSIHDFLEQVQNSGMELLTVLNDRYNYFLTVRAWGENLDARKDEIVGRWGRELYAKFRLYFWGAAHNMLTNRQQAYRLVLEKNPPG